MSALLRSFLAALMATSAAAQDIAWRTWGNSMRVFEGGTTVVDDLSGDGHEDLVVEARATACDPVGFNGLGRLWVLSGADGAFLFERSLEILGGINVPWVLWMCRAGDWDQDGLGDFATSQAGGGVVPGVFVYSGRDGSVLFSHAPAGTPYSMTVCDTNGDGWQDLVLGSEYSFGGWGMLEVVDHFGGTRYQISGVGQDPIGFALTSLNDVDDDGCQDFVAGCAHTRGANKIVSGRTGTFLRTCYGEQPGDLMFRTMDNCGDFDGDGYDDFVVGSGNTAASRRGMVVFSSRTGQVLQSWYPIGINEFGLQVVSQGVDLNGDGVADFLTGSYTENVSPQQVGAIYVFSGLDGSRIHRLISTPDGFGPVGNIGAFFCVMRPPAGGRIGTIIARNFEAINIGMCPLGGGYWPQGQIRAYRGLPRTSSLLGTACAGTLSTQPEIGLQTMAPSFQSTAFTSMRVHLSAAPPSAPSVLLLGAVNAPTWTPTPVPLDGIGLLGCALRSPVQLILTTTAGSSGSAAGRAFLDIPLPPPVQGNGTWWAAAQWLVLGSGATFPGGMTETARWRW